MSSANIIKEFREKYQNDTTIGGMYSELELWLTEVIERVRSEGVELGKNIQGDLREEDVALIKENERTRILGIIEEEMSDYGEKSKQFLALNDIKKKI